jgi:hypothetical protein
MKKIYVSLLLILIFSFFFSRNIYAKTYSLSIYPSLNKVNLNRGDNYKYYINIYNSEKVPIALKVYAQNFGVSGLSGNVSFIEDKSKLQSASWFKLKNTSIILYPQETLRYGVNIVVPKNAYPGGHYVSVFFQKVNSIKSNPSVGVIPRIGSLFFITIGGNLYYNAKIQKNEIKTNIFHIGKTYFPFFKMSNFSVLTEVKNLSNDYITEKGQVYINNSFDIKKVLSVIPTHILLQKEVRNFNSSIKNSLSLGNYKIYTSINYGYNEKVIYSKNIVVIPIYIILLTIMSLLFILYILTIEFVMFIFVRSLYI